MGQEFQLTHTSALAALSILMGLPQPVVIYSVVSSSRSLFHESRCTSRAIRRQPLEPSPERPGTEMSSRAPLARASA
jgi:hypothetical protein